MGQQDVGLNLMSDLTQRTTKPTLWGLGKNSLSPKVDCAEFGGHLFCLEGI